MKGIAKRGGKRVFVQKHAQNPEIRLQLVRDLAVRALEQTFQHMQQEQTVLPANATFYYICAVMLCIELGITQKQFVRSNNRYMEQHVEFGMLFLYAHQKEPLPLPQGFPYSIEDLRRSIQEE